MYLPIASDDVAAGDGAFRTWTTPSDPSKTKSSTIDPSAFIACARTPDGPGSVSSTRNSGMYRWSAATYALRTRSRYISPIPTDKYLEASLMKPGYVTDSRRSPTLIVVKLYPSRANASTAFGPSQMSPFMRG